MKNLRNGNVYFFDISEINNEINKILLYIKKYKEYLKIYMVYRKFEVLSAYYLSNLNEHDISTEFLDRKKVDMCNSIGLLLASKAIKILLLHSKYKSFNYDKDYGKLVEYFKNESNKTDYLKLYKTLLEMKSKIDGIKAMQAVKQEIRLSRRFESDNNRYNCERCHDFGCHKCDKDICAYCGRHYSSCTCNSDTDSDY